MAPKNTKKATRGGKGNRPAFPTMPAQSQSSEAHGQDGAAPESLNQAHENEILGIEMGYPEGFKRLKAHKTAWKQEEAAFQVTLTSNKISDSTISVSVTVHVVLPAAYPKTAPLITVDMGPELHDSYQETMDSIVTRVVREELNKGQAEPPIVHEVLSKLQEELDKAAESKARGTKLPSLEEQRVMQAAELAKKRAHQQAEEEELQRQRKQAETLKDKLIARNARREAQQVINPPPRLRPSVSISTPVDPRKSSKQSFIIDHVEGVKVKDINGLDQEVKRIKHHHFHSRGPVSDCYTVTPDIPVHPYQPLIIKHSCIDGPTVATGDKQKKFETDIDKLERDIRQSMKAGQGNEGIMQILALNVKPLEEDTEQSRWIVDVLMEFGSLGSLKDFLRVTRELSSELACEWAHGILDGLAWLHDHDIVHRDLHASNILLVQTMEGGTLPKIADVLYQDTLHQMTGTPSSNQLPKKFRAWIPTEFLGQDSTQYTEKTDIWFFGIILLQMRFGLSFMDSYSSPRRMHENSNMSESLRDLIVKVFDKKPRRRPRAVELKGYSLFTNSNGGEDAFLSFSHSLLGSHTPLNRRVSVSHIDMTGHRDRYAEEFSQIGVLGRGGFGEVLLARKKLDGQQYAVKRITEGPDSTFDEIVKEVQSLSSLHSPYIVRYYNSWVQYSPAPPASEGSSNSDSDETGKRVTKTLSRKSKKQMTAGTGTGLSQSLDWVSRTDTMTRKYSSDYSPYEEDGDEDETDIDDEDKADGSDDESDNSDEDDEDDEGDSEEDESEEDDEASDATSGPAPSNSFGVTFGYDDSEDLPQPGQGKKNRRRNESAIMDTDEEAATDSGAYIRSLYIQMENCAGATLRDAIRREQLYEDPIEITRVLRQMLEGLNYIHSKKLIHRDLKPENVFFDNLNIGLRTVKIGDFGLAAVGARQEHGTGDQGASDHEMTTNIGTANYVAPEINNDHYGPKADMYSLGIILFEMCYPELSSGMERSQVLTRLRQPKPELPVDFNLSKMGNLHTIMLWLLEHDQDQRPMAEDVLRSGLLPDSIGIDTIKSAMGILTNPQSMFHLQVIEAMLSRQQDEVESRTKQITWDLKQKSKPLEPYQSVMRSIVKEELTKIFRHHGALEVPRPVMFPISTDNDGIDVARVLGTDGTILQMRYDLMIPLAHSIATTAADYQKFQAFGQTLKLYAFGDVYRPALNAVIKTPAEVAFDIVSDDEDLPLKEAEVLKALEEITSAFPCLSEDEMCFNINHSNLLNLVFDLCGIQPEHRDDAIDRLGLLSTWATDWKVTEVQLLEKGLSRTSVMRLQDFEYRESPEVAFSKLRLQFINQDDSLKAKLEQSIAHIQDVVKYLNLFRVKATILIAPLGCAKEKVCRGGLTFSFQVRETKELLAAGGRYDALIKKFAQADKPMPALSHAVGFSLGWDNVTVKMCQYYERANRKQKNRRNASEPDVANTWKGKRCDVLVCSFDPDLLRNEGVSLVQDLWVHGISAELACDASNPDQILKMYADDSHYWTVTLKQDKAVKIRTIGQGVAKDGEARNNNRKTSDVECLTHEVVSELRTLIRERDGSRHSHPVTMRRPEQALTPAADNNIVLVQTDHRSRSRINDRTRGTVLSSSTNMVQQMLKESTIFAINVATDQELQQIQDLPLSAEGKWRDFTQRMHSGELRRQLENLHEELKEYRSSYQGQHKPRHVMIHNLRTQTSILYDVAL